MRTTITILLLTTMTLTGCTGLQGGGDVEIYGESTGGTITASTIRQEGSSTVLPLAEVWAEDFGTARAIQFTVAGGGSGRGASGLCSGELDLGDMSRTMKESERAECLRNNGEEPVEFWVAFDGLSVVVSQKNTFVQDLSAEQLEHIFRGDDPATRWNQIDPDFPDRPVKLCYPDGDSGTYEYFNEAILDGATPRTGNNVQQSHDDNVIVTCLAGDENAIGYFGYAYYVENTDKVNLVAVDGVKPTPETVADGSYAPLSRPIYIYTSGTPEGILADYFRYLYHPEGGQAHVPDVGYVPLDDATLTRMLQKIG